MNIQHVYAVYFSPTGNTKRLVCQAASEAARLFQVSCRAISLDLPEERERVRTFSAGDLVIVGGPTYAGKLPNKILPTYQEKLIGKGALAMAVVTYGNRSFDNALAELCATLDGNGFRTVAAGAFVGTHAFSDALAPNRPDEDDWALMVRLTDLAVSKIRQTDGMVPHLVVDGDAQAPYYVPKGVDSQPAKFLKAKPKTDLEKCVSCGLCARQCPMGSIDLDQPSVVTGICIKCQRCVRNCPKGAKYFDDPAFLSHVKMLETTYNGRVDNKIFI